MKKAKMQNLRNKIIHERLLEVDLLCLKIYFLKHLDHFISFLYSLMTFMAVMLFMLVLITPDDNAIFSRLFLLISIVFYSSFCLALPLSLYEKLQIEKFSRYAPPYTYETKLSKDIRFITPILNLFISLLLSVLNFLYKETSDLYVLLFSIMGCSSSIIINIFTWFFSDRSNNVRRFSEKFYADFNYESRNKYNEELNQQFAAYSKTVVTPTLRSFTRYCRQKDATNGTHYFQHLYYINLISLFNQLFPKKKVEKKLYEFIKVRDNSIYIEINKLLDEHYQKNKAIFNFL
jgi:hypothetical protein